MFKKNSILINKKKFYSSPLFILFILLFTVGILFFYLKDSATLGGDNDNPIAKNIEEWVMNNPDKIIESIKQMQERQMQEMMENAQKNIKNKASELYEQNDPQIAPKNYDVTIVEFFDYNCGYCKRASSSIEKLVAEDKKVRVIFKEYPILSKKSEELATVGVAVHFSEPNKYFEYHQAVMNPKNKITDKNSALDYIKKNTSIKSAQIIKILKDRSDEIQKIINNNRALAASIGITGTPAFIIGEELIPGAVPLSEIKNRIQDLRDNK